MALKCTPDNGFIRKSVCPYEKVLLSMGHFRAHDCWRACPPARRRESRSSGTSSLLTCPRQSASPLSLGCIEDEVPSARILRPPDSISPFTAIRKNGAANALRTTASYSEAFAVRAELLVHVCAGCLRARDCQMACSPTRRIDLRPYGARLALHILTGVRPPSR